MTTNNKKQASQHNIANSISIRTTSNVKSKVKRKLNLKQELFCTLYATDREFFGNGVESYLKAYGLDKSKYESAKRTASLLLTNIDILDKINELMDVVLNDIVVDKELAFTIKQKDNLSAKVSAIREYNQLRQRIIERKEVDAKIEIKWQT